MFLGAGLVLSGCGDDDTATTPAPAPPPPPPPAPEPEPEPEPPSAPATPTGFHVDTTETSLTWHWNAVEGAIGYAVQVSTDEMFDDTDTINPTAETSFTVADLPPQTTLYARVAAAAGTLEAPILSAWTTHVTGTTDMPPPPPPPPMAPATPTGFMVESDMTSITWSWDAVEGALGYAIQVSEDEMFDDMDHLGLTLETSHTVSPLPPGTTLFARVASGTGTPEAIAAAVATGSLEGLLVSAWTTHMTGMTMTPPPPPPPMPDPVEVTFMVPDDADDPYPMVPDDGTREETAMAHVNDEMMVMSNTDAIITPMFVENANGISVMEGDNTPFGRVDWGMLQSAVLDGGATFMVQRAVIGANQEMEPDGDVAYVTCGPFSCQDGMDAPMISVDDSAVCAAWDPELELQVGLVDNDVVAPDTGEEATDGVATDDGLDIGWITSSTAAMTVKHIFSGVTNGNNYSTSGPGAGKGSNKPLPMNKRDSKTAALNENASYNPGIAVETLVAEGGTYPADADMMSACVAEETYDETIGGNHRPDTCFRIRVVGDASANSPSLANYLSGYSVEVAAEDSAVSWGDVDWEDNPFVDENGDDLECESMTFEAADMVDVCDMFTAEVDQALSAGWGPRPSRKVTVMVTGTGGGPADTADSNVDGAKVSRWEVAASSASADRFKTLWFDHNLNGKLKRDTGPRYNADDTTGLHDLYNDNDSTGNVEVIFKSLMDGDGDPTMGDFGKVDLYGADSTPGDGANDGMIPDGKADNYLSGDDARACSDDDNGEDDEICDASWSESYDIIFADGTFGCSETRSVTITCSWDAQGQQKSNPPDTPNGALEAAGNIDNFAKCTVS